MRFSIVLGLATAFTVLLFGFGCRFGSSYWGTSYTLAVAAINAVLVLVLWGWRFAIRKRASKESALGFATLLHCWLYWFAFPCLGELP
jgi:hypothetical protein